MDLSKYIDLAYRRNAYRFAVAVYLAVAVLSSLGLLGKLDLLHRILPIPHSFLVIAIGIWVFLPTLFVIALSIRRLAASVFVLGLVCASLMVYPRMKELQQTGRGSDQPDCVIVAANGMATASWPYQRDKMWSHTPMSCGPGWVLLQTPVVRLAGYRWNLLALWILSIAVLGEASGLESVCGVLALLAPVVVVWVAASDGTDFLTFGILFAALFVSLETKTRGYPFYLALLVLVVQFRFPMLVLPVLMFPGKDLKKGVWISVSAFCLQLPLLVWNPRGFIEDGPLHLFYKLTHAQLLQGGRVAISLEVTLVFCVFLWLAIGLQNLLKTRWLAFAYLLLLAAVPASLDLIRKYHEYGSIAAAFGIWEGANWLSSCIPLAAILLLKARQADVENPEARSKSWSQGDVPVESGT